MRQRGSHIARIGLGGLGALLTLIALGVLWQLRPGLPAVPESWTSPMSSTQAEELLFWIVWLALAGLLLVIAYSALHELLITSRDRRHERTAAVAQRVLAKPAPTPSPSTRPSPPLSSVYDDKWFIRRLTGRPRNADRPEPAHRATAAAVADPGDSSRGSATDATTRTAASPSISLLGPLKIEGLQRPIKRVPTREMLAYLALHPAGASREELIDAIWPGQDPQASLQRLYQSVTEARKALGQAWVRDGERYQLDRTKLHIDLDQLDRLLANQPEDERQSLEAALELWRGEPLAGCDYPWADGDIHRLHSMLLELLDRLSELRLQDGDARGALQAAEQAIRLDQLHEQSWRLALQAEQALGLRTAVTKRYQALCHILDEQLGLQPNQETVMVYRRLLGQA